MSNPITDPLVENVIVDDIASVVKLEATPEGVAVVTIDRPAKRNALDDMAMEGLTEAFETLQGAEGVRIVFLRGAGGHFCAGGDLAYMRTALDDWTEDDNRSDAMLFARMFKALSEIPVATVALIEGSAHGAGAGLAAACDIAVAAAGASFSFPEVKIGLSPSIIAPYVVNAIGPREAKALFVTGRSFDAAYAERIGLVHEVVADAAAMDHAMDRYIDWAMTSAPEAVADAKRLTWDVWARPIDHGLMEETAKRLARARTSEEGREGLKAFLERRKAAWRG